MSYVSPGSRRPRLPNEPLLHRIGFDVDPGFFEELHAIPHGFRTKLLRELLRAAVKRAKKDGNEVYHQIIERKFSLSLDMDK